METWVDITGYMGGYQVSSYGRVRSFKYRELRILKQRLNSKGRWYVNLCKDGVCKSKVVHRLVAEMFICKTALTVNHIDGNKQNNHVENLEWLTIEENIKHGVENGLFQKGESNTAAKLNKEEVLAIRGLHPLLSSYKIALRYNISRTHVMSIIHRQVWKHI